MIPFPMPTWPRATARALTRAATLFMALPILAACTGDGGGATEHEPRAAALPSGTRVFVVTDTLLPDLTDAVGVAAPFLQATLSTRLMASVRAVHVREGDTVRRGQVLITLDEQEIDARTAQATGQLQGAEAMLADAERQTARLRTLYNDQAAPKAQLEAAEAGLARARAAVEAAHGGVAEASAMRDYGTLRAPFAGVITQRFVDPGAFASPGAPLITVQQSTALRVSAAVPAGTIAPLRRGDTLTLSIEGRDARGTIEGVVANGAPGLHTVNVIVRNEDGLHPVGGSARLMLPGVSRSARLIPVNAVRYEGDLAGVLLHTDDGPVSRWVRLGRRRGPLVEVLSGLDAGDRIVIVGGTGAYP